MANPMKKTAQLKKIKLKLFNVMLNIFFKYSCIIFSFYLRAMNHNYSTGLVQKCLCLSQPLYEAILSHSERCPSVAFGLFQLVTIEFHGASCFHRTQHLREAEMIHHHPSLLDEMQYTGYEVKCKIWSFKEAFWDSEALICCFIGNMGLVTLQNYVINLGCSVQELPC